MAAGRTVRCAQGCQCWEKFLGLLKKMLIELCELVC